MRRLRRMAVPAAALLLAGCAKAAPYDTLDPAGPDARRILDLFTPVLLIAAVIFVLVQGLLFLFIVRFKDRGQAGEPKQLHGNTKAEITWTIVPALILAVVSVPTVGMIFSLAEEPPDPVRIQVVGHQWWWEYRYEGTDVVTATELHIPVDRPIYLTLNSAEAAGINASVAPSGVIHSFWVPKLAGKQDVVPGHTHHLTIQADTPGTYLGQCVEFCGLSHANMRLSVVAHEPGEYEEWLDSQAKPAVAPSSEAAKLGETLFVERGCSACHAISGATEGVGAPNLTHFASRGTFAGGIFENNPDNLEAWLRNPPGRKPGTYMPNLNLAQDDIDALVAYLTGLK